jgi:hypothetical protein
VLAFSLSGQASPLSATLAPDAYSGSNAYGTMAALAKQFPRREPGSTQDRELADYVASQLQRYQFSVSANDFRRATVDGSRTLRDVIGIRGGQENGSIVLVAPRDALASPATAELSGTALLLELARVLSGETLQHTVALASTSGSAGGAGAIELARTLPQPVDAVIVLGDVAGTNVREPIVVPWSDGQRVAPPLLRSTVGAALDSQAGLAPGSTSLLGQLAHLVLPMAPAGQAPFNSHGDPAVLVSLSGEQQPLAKQSTSQREISAVGRAVLQAVNALDGAQTIPSPSRYLTFSGNTVPAWAVQLLGLALILPVLMAAIDGAARARRRGHPLLRWVAWVLAGGVPFVICALIVRAGQAVGAISGPTALPLGGDMIRLHAGELALLAALACLIVVGLAGWLSLAARRMRLSAHATGEGYGEGAAAGVLLVLCFVALALWLANPFAALLLVPALHLWMWVVVPDVKLPAPASILLVIAGLALPILVAVEYATTLGLSPLEAAWSWVLLIGGGGFGLASAIVWSLYLGCAASVIAIAGRELRQPRLEAVPVTIRGPVTYAGPGSLGGTKSALRR